MWPTASAAAGMNLPDVPSYPMRQASPKYTPPAAGVGGALGQAATQYAASCNVDPAFYTSVIDAESGFNPVARNSTPVNGEHATGMAQFLPSTAKQYNVDPLNPDSALDGGARYYSDLLDQHNGNYVKAAQSYGTLPRDLSNLNQKQQVVLSTAQAATAGQPTQLAQNTVFAGGDGCVRRCRRRWAGVERFEGAARRTASRGIG
jgi:soluble lytic murein transglycosylase-like protein